MPRSKGVIATRVEDEAARHKALEVLSAVYRREKRWVSRAEQMFPSEDLGSPAVSWFLTEVAGRPAGVTRMLFEIPFELYDAYGFELVDPELDVREFVRSNRIAEIGRFAVTPEFRSHFRVALSLMRAATTETVERGFSHLITDVFDGEPSSPYHFHRRVLGFETIATHTVGELQFQGQRITMLLDLGAAYMRYRADRSWIYRYIASGWNESKLDLRRAASTR